MKQGSRTKSSILDINHLQLSNRKNDRSSKSKRKSTVTKKVNEIKEAFKNKLNDHHRGFQPKGYDVAATFQTHEFTDRQDCIRFMMPVIVPYNNNASAPDKSGIEVGDNILHQYQVTQLLDDSCWPCYSLYEAIPSSRSSEAVMMKVYSTQYMHQGINEIAKWMYVYEQSLQDLVLQPQNSSRKAGFLHGLIDFFVYKNRLIVVTESAGSSLDKFKSRLSTDLMKDTIKNILEAVKQLNQSNIMHLNLNPDSIFMNKPPRVFLGDLSYSQVKTRQNRLISEPANSRLAGYWSPEALLNVNVQQLLNQLSSAYAQINLDEKSDIWSIGCILFEMYAQRPLIAMQLTPKQIVYIIKKSLDGGTEHMAGRGLPTRKVSRSLYNNSSLHHESSHQTMSNANHSGNKMSALDRNVEGILRQLEKIQAQDPDLYDLLSRMLTINPSRRISVQQAIRHPWF